MYIHIKRVCELVNGPFEICVENANDWTHFTHLHRKSHKMFQLLHKEGRREIFIYRARLLNPFPIFTNYVVCREYLPEVSGYRQSYMNLRTGHVHHLESRGEKKGANTLIIGEFWLYATGIWKYLPKLFFRLFMKRMIPVMKEDSVLIQERIDLGGFDNANSCYTPPPAAFHFLDELLKQKPATTPHSFSHTETDSFIPKRGV